MDIIKKTFGEKLKKYRKMRKYTQEKLSEEIGINLRQLARIVAGQSFVSSETLYNICIVLKIPPKLLFDIDIEKIIPDEYMNLNDIDILDNEIFNRLNDKLLKISHDKKKIEFLNLAYDSLFNRKSLNELKIMIKGIELTL